MRTLFERLRAAAEAFRKPEKTNGLRGVVSVDVTRDQMNDVVEAKLAEAFRDFDAPDGTEEAVGVIDPDTAGRIADDVVEDLPHVPDDALVKRVTLDAVNEVRVYYYLPEDADDAPDWSMTPNEFFEGMREVARNKGAGE